MTTDITIARENKVIPIKTLQAVIEIDETIQDSQSLIAEHKNNPVTHALILASSMQRVREMMTADMMADVMKLAHNPNGFLTDRPPNSRSNKPEYTTEEVADALITGVMQGFHIVGNEINIIAKKCYITKKALLRALKEWPGFAWIQRPKTGKSERRGATAFVEVYCSFMLEGKPCEMRWEQSGDKDYRTKVNTYDSDGPAMVDGRATRNAIRDVYEFVTGTNVDERSEEEAEADSPVIIDGDDSNVTDAEFEVDNSKQANADNAEDGLTEFQLLDKRCFDWLDKQLPSCKNLSQVAAVENKAVGFIRDNRGGLSDGDLDAIQAETIAKLCEGRREDIKKERKGKGE